MPTFDEERAANIARNRALLASIGVPDDVKKMAQQKRAPQRKQKAAPKKRKAPTPESDGSDNEERPVPKIARVEAEESEGGLRRSRRNAGKKIDYGDGGEHTGRDITPKIVSERVRRLAAASEPRSTLKRTQDP